MRISPTVLGLLVLHASPGLSGGQEADCNLCVAIVAAIEEFILNGDTMDDILNNVEGVCASFGLLQVSFNLQFYNNLEFTLKIFLREFARPF